MLMLCSPNDSKRALLIDNVALHKVQWLARPGDIKQGDGAPLPRGAAGSGLTGVNNTKGERIWQSQRGGGRSSEPAVDQLRTLRHSKIKRNISE